MDKRHYKDRSSASPSSKVLQRHDSKSHSVGALSSLLSREQKLQDDVRRHSSHGVQSDGKALVARGSRALSLQSPSHYGSAPTISSKQLLHESLSEGSLPRTELGPNISLNDAATIPFGLLYELAEKLNPLGHDTLNQIALLIGMTQQQFDKLYKSAINPARSLLTEGERFLNSLENLKVALEILQLTEAVDLIQKHQIESSRKATTTKIFPQISTKTVSSGSDTDSNGDNVDRPVFTLDDQQEESRDDCESHRVEGYTVMQGDPERCEGSILNIPDCVVSPDCREAFQQGAQLTQHKETKSVEHEPQSSRSCSELPLKDTALQIRSPYMEALLSTRSEGSQVDSGYGSTERSPLSTSDICDSATCVSDDTDGKTNITLSYKSFTQSCDVFCASNLIDERGGLLYIPNTSISLLVPEGALRRPVMIQLKVITDHTVEGCPQSASHPRLTPLVSCEPDGLEFLKAAELTLPHCGIIPNPEETVEVYVRRGGGEEDLDWKRDEYASRNAVLKLNTCSIPIRHFCDFDVFVQNEEGNIIGKKMRTFPMADCLEQTSDDILLSLWMCNDYEQEYKVIVNEKQDLVKNVLLDQYTSYMLEPSKQPVNVDYHNRSTDMWTLENDQEEIGYHQLWYGSKAKATFRMKCNSSTGGGKLNGTLTIKQKEHCESTKFELQHQVRNLLKEHIMQKEEPNFQTQQSYTSQYSVVSVKSQSSLAEQAAAPPPQLMVRGAEDEIYLPPTRPSESHVHIHLPSSSNEHSNIISPQSPPTFQVPFNLALKLSWHLNGDDTLGNDWRSLASYLEYSAQDISNFESLCKNPAKEMLLDACKKRRLRDFDQLRAMLKKLQRLDAVKTLDQYLEENSSPGLLAIEGPPNAIKPELCQQCSGEFSISTMVQPLVPTRQVDHAMLVQPLPAIQGPDVTSSEHYEPDQKYQSDIGGDQGYQMVIPSLPEIPRERGTLSLPCHTSTPRRLSSTAEDGENVRQSRKYVRGQGNDSGIDSPDISRQPSKRRITRSITLAPSFGGSEPNDSGPASFISETSSVDTKRSQGIASQSSSEDSGLANSPSSEDLVNSPPLEKLNNCFSSEN